MNNRGPMSPALAALSLIGMVLVAGCKEQGGGAAVVEPAGGAAPGAVAGSAPGAVAAIDGGGEAAVVPVVAGPPKWSRGDAGFARHLPADTDVYMEARQLGVIWDLFGEFSPEEAMQRLNMDKVAEAAGEQREDVEKWVDTAREELPKVLSAVFAEEAFVSVRGLSWWMKPYVHYQQEIYPAVIADMLSSTLNWTLETGEADDQMEKVMEGMMGYLRAEILSRGEWPALAVQMGGKVESGNREAVLSALRDWLALAAVEQPQFVRHEVERGGVSWMGFRLDLERLMEQNPDNPLEEKLGEAFGDEGWEQVQVMLEGMPLIVACGEVGDYVVLSAGFGEHALDFAAAPGDSLAAGEAFDVLTDHPEEAVFGTMWVNGGLVAQAHILQGWEPIWKGLADGVETIERFATAPLLAQSLREIGRLSAEKRAGQAHDVLGAVVVKDGLHLELRGGWEGKSLDLEAPLKLAGALLQWSERPFLRAHWRRNAEYTEKTIRQWEEGMKVMDLVKQEVSAAVEAGMRGLEEELGEAPDAEGEGAAELARKRRLAELMKRDFKIAMDKLWSGYRDHFREALGEETALIMDLRGEAPPIVGFEEETLKRGRIPRVAYVRSVNDRAELAVTWNLWRDAGVRLLGLMAEATETPIPFPDTMSANTDGLRTHFMPMPFATDDFLPSISVSDDLFIVGSSKALAAKIDESHGALAEPGDSASGVVMEIHMDPWWDFCEAWLEVAVHNRARAAEMEAGDAEGEDPEAAAEHRPDEGEERDEVEGLEALDEEPGEELEPDPLPGMEAEIGEGEEEPAGTWSWGGGFFDWDADADPEEAARGWIGKARQLCGASYRKWMEDGVPRARLSFHWGEAPPPAE